ncbi:MAG: hypothetical protein E7360_02950 [Clostridiales bacterium]|nr:hypothetical protein [Clostridiales bacterium]
MLSEERKNRINELIKRSEERGIFTYSNFISPTSVAEIKEFFRGVKIISFGGFEYAERQMLRFGDENEIAYEEDFPITLLKISLTGGKFASQITHRDVLGAVLNLGIERQKLGDIFINGNFSFVVAHKTVAPLILAELKSVGRNKVEVEEVFSLPQDLAPKKILKEFPISSNRADGVICKVFNLSREEGSNLCKSGFVTVNGKICEQAGKPIKSGETVAVKGFGKFTFLEEGGVSKKGKIYISVEIFN